jgi:hypothetical protein
MCLSFLNLLCAMMPCNICQVIFVKGYRYCFPYPEVCILILISGTSAQILFASVSYTLHYNFAEEQFGRTRGSVMVKALCYIRKVARSKPDEENFSIYLILPTSLGHGFYSATNRNKCHKHKNNVSGEQRAAGG